MCSLNGTMRVKRHFDELKNPLEKSLSLINPYCGTYFILYNFAFNTSYTTILIQNNEEGDEIPISFMRSNIQGVELKYLDVEKQGFTGLKEVKHFRPYLLKSKTKVIIPHPIVRILIFLKKWGKTGEMVDKLVGI